ncbi:hypothetical protein AAEX28_00795 [Lentisphaerota bacterium WC36G]|nr:hypothetical protein LJT99_03675 [Lentisphaerae bacterium WC36]
MQLKTIFSRIMIGISLLNSLNILKAEEDSAPNKYARYRLPMPSQKVLDSNKSKIDRIMKLTEGDLQKNIAKNNVADNCLIERDTFYVAEAYQVTKDENYAKRVILVLNSLANYYSKLDNIKKISKCDFN